MSGLGKDDDMKCSKNTEKPRVAQCPARPPNISCQHILFLEEGVFGWHKMSWMNFNIAWYTFHVWQAPSFVLKKHWQTLSWHSLFTFFFCYGHKYVPPVSQSSTQCSYNPHLWACHPIGTLFSVHVPQQTVPGLNQETRLRADFHSSFKKRRETCRERKFLFLCPYFLLRSSYLYKMRNNFHSKENKATIMKKWLVSAGYIDMQHLHTHMVLHQQNHAFRELLAARQDTMNHEQAQHRMYLNLEIKDHKTYIFLLPSRKYCNFSPV